jgi:hypothetical protein
MSNYNWSFLPNTGYITTVFSKEELQPIQDEINKIQENFASTDNVKGNHQLAGHIEHEFELVESAEYIRNLILPLVVEYNRQFNFKYQNINSNTKIELMATWVNFQKKYEFNPWHDHSGDLSFVLWISIPYDINDELKMNPGKEAIDPTPGGFTFCYADTSGKIKIQKFRISKDMERSMIIFPSSLVHSVYPFYTSDGYRISVSGNIKFKD